MFRKAQFFAKLPDRRGLIVALISLVLLAALVVLILIGISSVFVVKPLKAPLEKCSFSEDVRCIDHAFFEGAIKLVLLNTAGRGMIIRNVSATSETLEGGFCTTGNLDARLRRDVTQLFELDKKEEGSRSDDAYTAFYADYVASSGFARYAAVDAAADYAISSVVAAVLTAADSDGATADSVDKAARADVVSVTSLPIGTLTKAEVRKTFIAKHVAAAVSEAAGEDNATAYAAAEAVFYDSGQYVRYPGQGYYEADYDNYDVSDGASDAADAVSVIAGDAASGVVSSVTAAARDAAGADGATADSVAAAARNAADSYAAAARANASDTYSAADRSAAVAAASYAHYADSYYSDYSALELAGADSVIDWFDSIDVLVRAVSVEVSAAKFAYVLLSADIGVRLATSAASYDIIPFKDADYASNYYTSPYADAYQAIADVAADSVDDDYDDYYDESVAYTAAVDSIRSDPSGYEAAYKAAIDAYHKVNVDVIATDQNSSHYVAAYAAAHDVISAAYAAYSGSDSGDYTVAVSAFKAASDAAAAADYSALYPDDNISAATAGNAAFYAVYRSFDAAISVYPNASTADYVTYAAYSRDAAESAYADVYARDADAVAVTAEYVAAAVAKAASGVNSAGSPVSAKSAADDIIAAAKAAAADAVSAADSAADAVASSPDHQYVDGKCFYMEPDEADNADFSDLGPSKDLYDLELVYSWADEPGVNHVIKGELLTSAPQ